MVFEELSKIIRARKTNYAFDFTDKEIEKSTIEAIVENAIWAPTHKHTQPWRFVVLTGKHCEDIGSYMACYYRNIYDKKTYSDQRFEETKTYAKNATLLALIFTPDKRAKLAEWEEIAAFSCAVQNMWLSCTSLNLGCYWDTAPGTIAYIEQSIEMKKEEKCLGVLYMGHLKENITPSKRKRKSLTKKLSWSKK